MMHIATENVTYQMKHKDLSQKNEKLLVEKKVQLAKRNETAKLWVQLLDYINTFLLFIRAEQLGDWEMHLTATHAMFKFVCSNWAFHLC